MGFAYFFVCFQKTFAISHLHWRNKSWNLKLIFFHRFRMSINLPPMQIDFFWRPSKWKIEHNKLRFKNFQQLFIWIENCWLSRRALLLGGGIVGEIILHGKTINYFFTLHWSKENLDAFLLDVDKRLKKLYFYLKKDLNIVKIYSNLTIKLLTKSPSLTQYPIKHHKMFHEKREQKIQWINHSRVHGWWDSI